MSISEEKSEENNNANSNMNHSEEPKITQEQRSGIDPSTEFGTGINEFTGTDTFINNNNNSNNNSTYRLNPNFNQYMSYFEILPHNLFVEDEPPVEGNQESVIFDADEYYNYNEIFNSYFSRQFGRQLTFDNLNEKINSLLTNEKNYIEDEKQSIKRGIKCFNTFKESYLKQKRAKKEELKNLFLNEDNQNTKIINDFNSNDKKDLSEINIINENDLIKKKEFNVEIEFSKGEIIKEEIKLLTKYPNSILAACINGKISLPRKKGHIFFDRNYDDFKLLLYYLKKGKMPKFKNVNEEKIFFKELDFWRIPLKINTTKLLQFDLTYTASCFNIEKNNTTLTNPNNLHGIILLNKSLTALTPYVEFSIFLFNPFNNNKKFFFGLVNKKHFLQNHINNSFEDGSAPFIFYWDIYKNKVIKNRNGGVRNWVEFKKPCQCYWNNYEIKFGMKYDQRKHSISLYRNDIELDVEISNIDPGMVPAIELHLEECKIQLSPNCDCQELFYL